MTERIPILRQYPTISVLIPNYNHAHYLPLALDAILAQSYRPLEIIIVDDCSTDNSIDVIARYALEHSHIRCIRNDINMGAAAIGNRLLELARGEYVYFAAADDQVLPGLFEKSAKLLSENVGAGLCSALARTMDERGVDLGVYQSRVVSRHSAFFSTDKSLELLRRHGNWMVGCTIFFRREELIAIGGFVPDLGPFIDGFTQQVIALRSGACFISECLAYWRQSEAGYSLSESRKIELYFENVTRMIGLMRTTDSNLFPLDYVDRYERECLYGVAEAATRNFRREHTKYRERISRALEPLEYS